MARLIKNIDTISHGSLKAGRLLNGLMDNSRIAELIASGHAIATEEDGDLASAGGYDAAKLAFEHGYASAVNDAVDAGLITRTEAGSCVFEVEFEDDGGNEEMVADDSSESVANSDTSNAKKSTQKKGNKK